jgi:hypothetical protein
VFLVCGDSLRLLLRRGSFTHTPHTNTNTRSRDFPRCYLSDHCDNLGTCTHTHKATTLGAISCHLLTTVTTWALAHTCLSGLEQSLSIHSWYVCQHQHRKNLWDFRDLFVSGDFCFQIVTVSACSLTLKLAWCRKRNRCRRAQCSCRIVCCDSLSLLVLDE